MRLCGYNEAVNVQIQADMRFKKFIAVILAVWLPLFSGDALAVTVSMQSACEAHAIHAKAQIASAQHHAGGMSCKLCGFCHLAATGFLVANGIIPHPTLPAGSSRPFHLSAFSSIASPPLVPPPLAAL